jgi:hypothetical protein
MLRALLLTLLIMTRMEGVLLAAIILLSLAGKPGTSSIPRAWAVGWRTGLLSSPYLIYLIAICWNGGFITGQQYLVLTLAFCAVLLVMRGSSWPGLQWVNGRLWLMLVAGNSAVVAILVLWKPAHMLNSLGIFAQNMFDPGFYGYTFALIALGAVVHAATRGAGWLKPHATDAYYIHGVSVILINMALVAFREPFHRSWQDSGTRLLMHVLPGLIVWLVVLIARLPGTFVPGNASDDPAARAPLTGSTPR